VEDAEIVVGLGIGVVRGNGHQRVVLDRADVHRLADELGEAARHHRAPRGIGARLGEQHRRLGERA